MVEFNVFGKDKSEWGASSLLASVEIKNGVCEYAFSPLLASKLLNPAMYAKLNPEYINAFRSKYALALYELFADYKEVYQTPLMRLDDFKKIMGVEDKYPEFKALSKRVITPALNEVNSLVGCCAKAEFAKT